MWWFVALDYKRQILSTPRIDYLTSWMEKLAVMNPHTHHITSLLFKAIYLLYASLCFFLFLAGVLHHPSAIHFHFYHVFHNGLAYTNWPVRDCKEVAVMCSGWRAQAWGDGKTLPCTWRSSDDWQLADRRQLLWWMTVHPANWRVQKWVFLVMPKLTGYDDFGHFLKFWPDNSSVPLC